MIRFVILDGAIPRVYGQCATLPNGAVKVDHDPEFYAACMLVDGLWEARPAIDAPAIKGGTVTFSQLPDGAIVTVTDIEAGFDLATIPAVAGCVEFELADSAEYLIRATAPLPWMPWEGRVTC
jgi:hypothetical protein